MADNPRKIEIKPENGAIAIRVINADIPNVWEYYQFGAVKSVLPVFQEDYGVRQADNQRKRGVRYDNLFEFIISFHDEDSSPSLRYNLEAVDNQPTWTNDYTGLSQAVSDINSWIVQGTSGLLTETAFKDSFDQVVRVAGVTNVPTATSGSVAAGFRFVNFFNDGNSDILVAGGVVGSGLSVPFPAGGENDVLNEITYDSQGSTILITTVL